MPADLLTRIDLDLIYPPFLKKVLDVIAACRARGSEYWATRGTASWLEQHKLRLAYLQGGPRAAEAGYSQHNYGLAIDFAPDGDLHTPGLQPVWDPKAFDPLVEETVKAGLASGRAFRDSPHVGWASYQNRSQLVDLLQVSVRTKGLQLDKLHAVWRYLDANPVHGV